MKVISINSLPKFDVKLNDQYNMILPSVIKQEATTDRQTLEIEYPSDWRSFRDSSEQANLIILNSQNNEFDRLIDFEDRALCEKIEYLTIYGAIGHISDKIGRLANLKSLRVADVSSISPYIGTLQKLEELILEHCYRLEYIPFGVYEIQSLKKLTINSLGYYENLSPRINRLTSLEHLTLKDHFPFISEEIAQLPQLKCLDIERPHDCVFDIPSLEVLHLRVTGSNLLRGINKLGRLKELWLDAPAFGDEINELTSLQYLIIFNFAGASLPDLGRLQELELLVLHDCPHLTGLPDFVFNLPNLKYLGLRFLNSLTTLPAEINHIPQLKYLDLTKGDDVDDGEMPVFRSGLMVYRLSSWNSYERIN